MFSNHKIGKYSGAISAKLRHCAIALGFVFLMLNSLSLNAQTNRSEYSFLEDIEPEEDLNWSFSSEDEIFSVKDEIEELGEYNISESDSMDIQLIEENRRWGNRGRTQDYSIEAEVYNY